MSLVSYVNRNVLVTAVLCAAAAACMRPSPDASLELISQPRAVVSPRVAAPCPAITEDLAEQGRKIFKGPGNCYTCHGPNAKGTPLAPDLTDQKWLQIDGSFPAIVTLIQTGVPKPKEHPAPMLPMGGAHLSEAQVCAVGAYVFTLSHPLK